MRPTPTPHMAAAALAALPGVGPARLAALLGRWSPEEAWARVLEGRAIPESPPGSPKDRPDGVPLPAGEAAMRMARRWRHAASGVDFDELSREYRRCGVGVVLRGSPGYPSALAEDPEPPAVLFWRGDLAVLHAATVAVVGARRCTGYGRDVARSVGQGLAEAGVAVVSGLALGIDGAAHEGVLRAHSVLRREPAIGPGGGDPATGSVAGLRPPSAIAPDDDGDRALGSGTALDAAGPNRPGRAMASGVGPPIAVVGGGLDCVYPSRHARLWAQVEATGVILSEAPLGAPPAAWRFPLRNRILAGLAEVVVVVESYLRGGSRHTVDAATMRDKTVLAVPGPVHNPASALPHELLHDGCGPARDVGDVLVALGLATAGEPFAGQAGSRPYRSRGTPSGAVGDPRPSSSGTGATLLDLLGWRSQSLEELVVRSGLPLSQVSTALSFLEQDGWVRISSGRWEQVGPRPPGGP